MAHSCRGYTTIFLLLLCVVCISASQYENIKVENLILRMDGDKLKAGMVDPSFTTLDFQELPGIVVFMYFQGESLVAGSDLL